MLRRLLIICAVLAVTVAATAVPGLATEERRGSCSGGPGHWELRVSRDDAQLRIRFEIDDVPSGQSWQIFISDNGRSVFSGTRTSNDGHVRVRVRTRNRAGTDRIKASGVNTKAGTTCAGRVAF